MNEMNLRYSKSPYPSGNSNHFSINASLKWLALIVPSLLIILAIWLPFGFNLTGLIEEWGILGSYINHGLFFIADTSSPLAAHALRPLTIFPHAIAYFLDPDSFNYWHVLLIAVLLIKGIALSTLLLQATGSLRFAMLAGLLVLIYPADTMQLSFRGLHINFALSLLLLSCSLFIAAYRSPKTINSYTLGLSSAVLLIAALSMYETSLALIFLPFLMIYVKDGFRASLKLWYSRKGLLIIWVLSIALYLVYVVVASSQIQESYQESLVSKSPFTTLQYTYLKLFNPGLIRSFLGGWFDAIRILLKEIGSLGYLYLLAATTIIFGFIVCIVKSENKINVNNPQKPLSFALIRRLALVGFLLTLLGYSFYLFLPSHLAINQRTYLFATPGAAIFWTAFIMMIAQWRRLIALFLAIPLIAMGLGFQLFQFHHYDQISETQRTLLRNIIANFDGKLDKKTLILLDGSNQLFHTWMFPQGYLQTTLTYFYGHSIKAIEVCQMPGKEWRSVENSLTTGTCIENEKEWILRAPAASKPAPDKIVSKDNAIVLTINPNGSIAQKASLTVYRDSLHDSENHQAKRYRNILSPTTWTAHFNKLWAANTQEKFKWSFGNWWSMELPIPGSGWREAEWFIGKFYHHAAAWKAQENATIIFDLVPRQSAYFLRGRFESILNEPIRESIQIRVNQDIIPFQWLGNGEFEAKVSYNSLLVGSNTIVFHSKTDPAQGLSVMLAWFEILPA
jgi:hypothetical protein